MITLNKDIQKLIIEGNNKREDLILSTYACKNSEGQRRYPKAEKVPDNDNIRSTFFHDTDKIIHSLAYTRYIDKTQVFFLFENDHITHRVLHVQFVSKIARVIGRCLRLNEDLIEAISLGHDIGHVPYGHDGERYLDAICRERNIGRFAHNAQSVRSLMELEKRGSGLNLTLQVLDGILCHNGEILSEVYSPDKDKNWDKFLKEYNDSWSSDNFNKGIRPMTLEGCVVRLCDIIGYIGRDIEDAVIVGLIKRDDLPREIVEVLGDTNDQIINNLVNDIINNSFGKDYIAFSKEVYSALFALKDFNNRYIYSNSTIKTQNKKIENMFRNLFDIYLKELKDNKEESQVEKYAKLEMGKQYSKNNSYERIVLDFISGMTDDFFNEQFKGYFIPESFGMKVIQ